MRRSAGFSGRETAAVGGGVSQRAGALSDLSPRGQALGALKGLADHGPAAVAQKQGLEKMFGGSRTAPAQLMKVRGIPERSTVSSITADTHVVGLGDQPAKAIGNFGDSTFVAEAKTLTDAVDAHGHSFVAPPADKTERQVITASVPVHQYNKVGRSSEGLKPNKPAALDPGLNGMATNCEIGAFKNGTDAIQIDHFKKAG